ncbi:MAG: hypothetical protein M1812_006113 [Candelaria pacifica]|nr:MAG: hypothetical protein M1812_006113 [Candelaria pacifica]
MALNEPADWVRVHQEKYDRSSESEIGIPDGLSLYRALSRQMNGDPSKFNDTMNAVLDHFLRVWSDPSHTLHKQYDALGRQFVAGDIDTFFGALSCPDVAFGQWHPETGARKVLMDFIANALNVRIVIWKLRDGSHQKPDVIEKSLYEDKKLYGDATFPVYHMLATPVRSFQGKLPATTHFDSLLPDESGKALIQYMMKEKVDNTMVDIKEMHWWWGEPRYNLEPDSFNEYAMGIPTPLGQPTNNLRSFSIFTVNVEEPQQIRPALALLDEAMRRSPAQEIPVSYRQRDGSERPLRRYMGIDAEFLKIRLPDDFDYQGTAGDEEELRKGSEEQLCGILTIAVDRHVVFSFHVLHMLENPTETTVNDLCELFRRTIFNKEYLKIWFNYQTDFDVLDSTIAHMFQGSNRPRYLHQQWINRYYIEPTFKFSSPFFNGQRPADLIFSTVVGACEFHTSERSTRDRRCPCDTGNLDISAILAYITRQLGCGGQPRAWKDNRPNYNYGNLLRGCFDGHRLYPILWHWKQAPGGRGPVADEFYSSLRPGMEMDERKMGYNIGDVVGNALIMRFLLTTDDRVQRKSPEINGTYLTYVEHEELASIGRSAYQKSVTSLRGNRRDWNTRLSAAENDTPENRHAMAVRLAHYVLFDPTKFFLPSEIMTTEPQFRYQGAQRRQAIVRAGTHHSDDLIRFIRSARSARTGAPEGFMFKPGKPNGLPRGIRRSPGDTLRNAKAIKWALEHRANCNSLPSPPFSPVPQPDRDPESELLAEGHEKPGPFEHPWLTVGRGRRGQLREPKKALAHAQEWHKFKQDVWDFDLSYRHIHIDREKEEEEERDEIEGIAGRLDPTDIFDPEERIHKRNLERGPRYNAKVQYRKQNTSSNPSFAQQLSSRVAIARRRNYQALKVRQSVLRAVNNKHKRPYRCDEWKPDASNDRPAKAARVH